MKRFPVILAPALLGSLLMLGGCATTGPNTAPLPPDRDCQEVYTVAPGNYIIDIAEATRHHTQLELGISPRGSLALMDAARAYALLNGRDYVRPDDVQKLAEPVLLHRIQLKSQAVFKQQSLEWVLNEIIRNIRVPGVN